MSRLALPLTLILGFAAGSLTEFLYCYPQLPAVVASHFNAQGLPNDRMPKQKYAGAMACLFIGLLTGTALMVGMMRYAPSATINLPHKKFWLAPERAAATRRMLLHRTLWFWAALWLYFAWLSHVTLQFNLGRAQVAPFLSATVFLLGFMAFWIGELFWRFSRTPSD